MRLLPPDSIFWPSIVVSLGGPTPGAAGVAPQNRYTGLAGGRWVLFIAGDDEEGHGIGAAASVCSPDRDAEVAAEVHVHEGGPAVHNTHINILINHHFLFTKYFSPVGRAFDIEIAVKVHYSRDSLCV